MREVFSYGRFYGATRRQIETSAFVFAEVEDFVDSRVPTHTHENAHFLFVVRGHYQASIKEKKRPCPASTMIYYPAGTTHADHFYTSGGKFLTVSLTSETSKKLLAEIKFFDYSIDFTTPEISRLGKRICRELQAPDNLSPIVLEGMASELLVFAARHLDKSGGAAPVWLRRAHELLRDCCRREVTVAEIAVAVGVHPIHLARTFRRFFGCSPGEYMRRCRIEAASNLLLESKKTLVEIALISGFADQSQFTRSFRQYAGTTPAKFRQLHGL